MPRIDLTTTIDASTSECFALSLSVDAHTESMGTSGEQAVAGVTGGEMSLGDSVTWRARHFGIPFMMTSRITEYQRPERFVDEQVSGPFKAWRHEHVFTQTSNGTLMTDIVTFSSPAGALGNLVNRALLTSYMTRLLQERNEWLRTTLAG